MNFRQNLEEFLKKDSRFQGISCGRDLIREDFVGYELCNVFKGKDLKKIAAGLIMDCGVITGFRILTGEESCDVSFVSARYLDELIDSVKVLADSLIEDRDIGNQNWISLRFSEIVDSRIKADSDLMTNDKIIKFDNVLVNLGVGSAFSSLIFTTVNSSFIACIAESKQYYSEAYNGLRIGYEIVYEAVFESAQEGNLFYKRVKNSSFVSKKKNTIYKISEKDFINHFKRVNNIFIET